MWTVEQVITFLENEQGPESAEVVRKLVDRSNELSSLEYAGVDNWSGYSYAFEQMEENFPETYKRKYGE